MKLYRWFGYTVLVSIVVLSISCSDEKGEKHNKTSGTSARVVQDDFHGWDSFILRNQYVRMDVVPELGGKIMGYGLHGLQVLWHDTTREGEVDNNQGYGFGETFFNPGGAKVWPAPQGWSGESQWPGPPDNVLDSAPYDFDYEGDSITVTSPDDNAPGRSGLRFTHTYSVAGPNSLAELNLSMKNVVDRPVTWSLWHLATVPVDRQFTVYVPVNDGDWHVMFGEEDNPQWLGVENGLFRARYDKRVGKVGVKAREGWIAWHDEENDLVFAMLFPIEAGKEYPDGGSNVEIWTTGAGTITTNGQEEVYEYTPESAMMELELLGPLTRLKPGESASMDVRWGVTKCSDVVRVTPDCVVSEELAFDRETGITGRFGSFHGGDLYSVYLDDAGKTLSNTRLMGVSPLGEVIIRQDAEDIVTWRARTIRYQVVSSDKKSVSILGEVTIR